MSDMTPERRAALDRSLQEVQAITAKRPYADAETAMEHILNDIFPSFAWDEDSSRRTAERFVAYLREYQPVEEAPFNFTTFPSDVNQMIVVKDIEFASVCKHHLLPFQGVCHVGYVPGELMVGVSKIPRLVNWRAARPQTQELLTAEIASFMKQNLKAMGVAVIMDAVHTCMCARGVRKVGASMRTSEMRGIFLTADAARSEFLRLAGL